MPISCEQAWVRVKIETVCQRGESGLARVHLCPIERSLPTTFSSCKLKVHSCTTRCCTATFLLSIFITITIIINIFAFQLSLSLRSIHLKCAKRFLFSLCLQKVPLHKCLFLNDRTFSFFSTFSLPIRSIGGLPCGPTNRFH